MPGEDEIICNKLLYRQKGAPEQRGIVHIRRLIAKSAEALGERSDDFMRLKVEGIHDCAELLVAALMEGREAHIFGRRTLPEMDLASVFSHLDDDLLNGKVLEGYLSDGGSTVSDIAIKTCLCLQILLFIICQHNRFAGEKWFSHALDRWCAEKFAPLLKG